MRKFIVLHNADFESSQPMIVYIDAIKYITPRVGKDEKIDATNICLGNWVISVQESISEVMKKIKEQENGTNK